MTAIAVQRGELPTGRSGARGWVIRHPLISFFAFAYAFTWLLWTPAALDVGGALAQLAFVVGIWGPALGAALITWYTGGSLRDWARPILRWRVPLRWYAVALAVPPLLMLVPGVALIAIREETDFSVVAGNLVGFLPSLLFIMLLGGGNEEPGWRGFALPRLQARLAPVAATLRLGVLWATWHLPMLAIDPDARHGLSDAGFALAMLVTWATIVGYAFWLTWMYNRTASILLCALLHAGFNVASVIFVPLSEEAAKGDAYPALLATSAGTLFVAVAILVALTRGRLGYQHGTGEPAAAAVHEERAFSFGGR
jgi:membrane protease YdiL (CAAX protease family)